MSAESDRIKYLMQKLSKEEEPLDVKWKRYRQTSEVALLISGIAFAGLLASMISVKRIDIEN